MSGAGQATDEIQGIVALTIWSDLVERFEHPDPRQCALIKATAAKAAILGSIDHEIRNGRCSGDVAGPRTAVTLELAELLFALGPLDRIADTIALRTFADAYRAITEVLATEPAAGSA